MAGTQPGSSHLVWRHQTPPTHHHHVPHPTSAVAVSSTTSELVPSPMRPSGDGADRSSSEEGRQPGGQWTLTNEPTRCLGRPLLQQAGAHLFMQLAFFLPLCLALSLLLNMVPSDEFVSFAVVHPLPLPLHRSPTWEQMRRQSGRGPPRNQGPSSPVCAPADVIGRMDDGCDVGARDGTAVGPTA